MNIILNTDSYKTSHFNQYPPGTDGMFCYLESRGGLYPRTLFFGLQAIIDRSLHDIFDFDIEQAEPIIRAHGLPFNREGWDHIRSLGHLPLRIRAAPEGSVIPTGNILMSVESTDPRVPWLASYVETALLRVWYPTTVATISWHIKQRIKHWLELTGDPSLVDFKLHDFGARGVSSEESAGLGGMAHLVNFKGTDTLTAVLYAKHHYDEQMAGFSIPAMEHSTVTSWGRDGEVDAFSNMLDQYGKPGALLACVSDSYDLHNAVSNLWGGKLRKKVQDLGATVVIRPDSGDPEEIVRETVRLLANRFGYQTNAKGYNVLNNVRVIQGDGVNPDSIEKILRGLAMDEFSADNIAFGMGGALLQKLDRDTQRFAYKCSAISVKGIWRDVQKMPATDMAKASKAGRLNLYRDAGGNYHTTPAWDDRMSSRWTPVLETVWENGVFTRRQTLQEIRDRSNA